MKRLIVLAALAALAGGGCVAPKPEPPKPAPVKPEPAKPEPAKPEPAKPAPVKPEPAKPEPAKPEPAKPEPAKPKPTKVEIQQRDLTPVTWMAQPAHAPIELVYAGVARAVVYVADPKGKEAFVDPRAKLAADSKGQETFDPEGYRAAVPPALPRLLYELVEAIRLSTGATLERVDRPPAADRTAIVVGDCGETRSAGIDASKIPVEGFVVKTTSNRVYLVGSTQALPAGTNAVNNGTAWAVADFLERLVGVRWYWPAEYGGRSIRRDSSLFIPPVHYSDQPVCRLRTVCDTAGPLQARVFDQQLLSMAPGVLPEGEMGVSMTTHLPLCRYGNSWPDEGAYSRGIAEAAEDPGNLLVHRLQVPPLGLMQQPALRREQDEAIRARGPKSGRPLTVWNSFQSPSDWTHGPVQFPHVVQNFYRANRGLLGGVSLVTDDAACWITAAPTFYVCMRSLWNPDLDVDAALDEMCRRLFGPAAGSARELLRLECQRWEGTVLSQPLGATEGRLPPKLFQEIWPPDVVTRMKALRDKALAELAGEAATRQAFHYWTWTFDAFLKDAEALHEVMPPVGSAVSTSAVPAAVSALDILGSNDADARFKGGAAEANHVRIAKTRRVDTSGAGQSDVQFDFSWGHTWRQKWTEPAEQNVTGRDLRLENWSAAWVFVKFRKVGGDAAGGWSHATLAPERTRHAVSPAATLDVGQTRGRGVGVFIYPAGPGYGPLDLKNVRLRWLHGVDGVVDPAQVELKVFAVEMVYVPQGAFALGSGPGSRETGHFHEGANSIREFVVTADWSKPLSDLTVTPARRIGKVPGRLWGATEGVFDSRMFLDRRGGVRFRGESDTIGPEGPLSDGFPTGYEAFYCMRYEVTAGQFAEFLNTISKEDYDSTDGLGGEGVGRTARGRYGLSGVWPDLTASRPYQACNFLSWWDGAKYAAWAGLRPMSELEYEKACRGPLKPVANEFAWGTTGVANVEYVLANEGKADETIAGNYSTTGGNANYDVTLPALQGGAEPGAVSPVPGGPLRAGIFATLRSGRVAAGASYWGILELSGNLREQVVTVGNVRARGFEGTHGAGTLEAPDDWPEANYSVSEGWNSRRNDAIGSGLRGGCFNDTPVDLRTSDRTFAAYRVWGRGAQNGWRGVRTAPLKQGEHVPGYSPEDAEAGPARFRLNRRSAQFVRLDHPVRVDGVLYEWGEPSVLLRGPHDIFPIECRLASENGKRLWQGPADLGAKVYWGFDGEAICVAAEVTDDVHSNVQTGEKIWNGDAMQIGLVISESLHWNIGLALTREGVVFHQWEGGSNSLVKTAECTVVRDAGGTTRYELRLPLAAIGLELGAPFGFNIAFPDDDDGNGCRYWLQLAPGLCGRDFYTAAPAKLYPRFALARRLARLDRLVRPDGVLDEWGGKPMLTLGRAADVVPEDCRSLWKGPEDLSVKAYVGWDGEAICVAAEVTDDAHFNTKTGDKICDGDAMQVGLVTAAGGLWNIGLALTPDGVVFHQWEGRGDVLLRSAGRAVVRDDAAKITRYELRLPLAAIGVEADGEFGLDLMFFDDDDGNGRRYGLQLAPGLAYPFKTDQYRRFLLVE